MIKFNQKGNFNKLDDYMSKLAKVSNDNVFDRYGEAGVRALMNATPMYSGETARSWYYTIENSKDQTTISFCNSNIQNGVLVAILLQYGHATKNGGWVEGIDFINPTLKPIFENLAESAWREVTSL